MSETVGLKFKLAARVIYTNWKGDREYGRVVDASRDHVTVQLASGRTVRLEDNDIAMCLSKPTASQRRSAPRFY